MEPLASAEQLAAETGTSVDDPRLLLVLNRASDRFRGAVRHPVSLVTDDTVVLDGNGTRTLVLRCAPVVAVSTVTVRGELLDDRGYSWSANGYLRRLGWECWPDGLRAVTVTYDHGYDPIPGDITDAVLGQAVLLLEQVERYKSIQVGDEQFTFANPGVTGAWSEVVERYRLNRGDRS